jgi:hypothetical protein
VITLKTAKRQLTRSVRWLRNSRISLRQISARIHMVQGTWCTSDSRETSRLHKLSSFLRVSILRANQFKFSSPFHTCRAIIKLRNSNMRSLKCMQTTAGTHSMPRLLRLKCSIRPVHRCTNSRVTFHLTTDEIKRIKDGRKTKVETLKSKVLRLAT